MATHIINLLGNKLQGLKIQQFFLYIFHHKNTSWQLHDASDYLFEFYYVIIKSIKRNINSSIIQ